jgi:hypothetical protein
MLESGVLPAAVRRARQAGEAIPGAYADFVRRVEAAFGVGAGDDAVGAGRCARPDDLGYVAGQPGQARGPAPTSPDGDAMLVREIADALWQRLNVFRRYAEKLERELCLHLIAWATDPAVPYDRRSFQYAQELAWEVVAHDFGHFEGKAVRAARAAEKRLAAGFYALSVERWGKTAECASLAEDGLPDLGERYWAWQVTHPKPGMEMPQLDFSDTADQFLRAIELLKGAGIDVGKTIPAGYETE